MSTRLKGAMLHQVSRDVYWAASVQPAEDSASSHAEDGPSIVLLFGWMDAKLPHLKKYMDSYAKVYPSASQIIVRSPQSLIFTGSREASIAPVVDILKREGMFGPQAPSLLVHAFSNGGGLQLLALSQKLHAIETPRDPPAVALILDSVPGRMELVGSLNAMLGAVKSPLMWYLLSIPLIVVYYGTIALSFVTRTELEIDRLRNGLNQQSILPWTTKDTPRLYLYSDTDKLVREKAVVEHMADATGLGLNARGVLFKGSAHVAHARQDPDRYWMEVLDTWKEAVAK